jgi:hypothetical protein
MENIFINEIISSNNNKGLSSDFDLQKVLAVLEYNNINLIRIYSSGEREEYRLSTRVYNHEKLNVNLRDVFEKDFQLPPNPYIKEQTIKVKYFKTFSLIKHGVMNEERVFFDLSDDIEEIFSQFCEPHDNGLYTIDFNKLHFSNKTFDFNLLKEYKKQEHTIKTNTIALNYFIKNHKTQQKQLTPLDEFLKNLNIKISESGEYILQQEAKSQEDVLKEFFLFDLKEEEKSIPNSRKDIDKILLKINQKQPLTEREKYLENPIKKYQHMSYTDLSKELEQQAHLKKELSFYLFEQKRLLNSGLESVSKDILKEVKI